MNAPSCAETFAHSTGTSTWTIVDIFSCCQPVIQEIVCINWSKIDEIDQILDFEL